MRQEDTGAPRAVERWTSTPAFLFAAVGAAVGLGNLWRFPYVAGENGGGAFILVYLLFVFLLGVPIMAAEMTIGRRGGSSAVGSVNRLIAAERRPAFWKLIGGLSVLIPFVGLSYYSVVAAWVMDYVWLALLDAFRGLDGAGSLAQFDALTSSVGRQVVLHFLFIAITVAIVCRGVNRGIEIAARVMMPGLFVLLLGLVVYNVFTMDFAGGVSFLFTPDFARLTTDSILLALGQAFFSVAIGVGVIMTYSAYLPRGISLPGSAGVICSLDALVAILAGLAIFPIVFQFGLNPGEGPNLIFVTLPVAFGQMPGGWLVGVVFFTLVFFAAFTTAIGMLEPVVAFVRERVAMRRPGVTISAGLLAWLIGLPSLLSFNLLGTFFPLEWTGRFVGMTAFDVLDFIIANVLLPVNGLLIALFVGWGISRIISVEELGLGEGYRYSTWLFIVRFVAPIAIAGLILDLWL